MADCNLKAERSVQQPWRAVFRAMHSHLHLLLRCVLIVGGETTFLQSILYSCYTLVTQISFPKRERNQGYHILLLSFLKYWYSTL